MENLFNHLEQVVLRMDSRFCTEDGHLLKNNVIEAALALDPKLLHYLLADEKLKKQFFSEVDGLLVFDKVKFQRFVMNKQFLPDSYTAFKNKVGLTNENGEFLSESREVVLSWPYKDCMLEGGQTKEDAKRQEIFWNETLAPDEINRLTEPKALCHFLRYDSKGEHEATELRPDDNLIIKGNNLLALYSLRERFRNSVKLIYIDPPYNTGNDSFGYNDSFNHSTWLTFMKNRLEVAKELLRNDGTIAISIDHNELGYCILICDLIFGKSNLKNIITVKRGSVTGAKVINPGVVNLSDYVLIYAKDSSLWKPNRVLKAKDRDERYNQYIVNYEEPYENWQICPLADAFADTYQLTKERQKKILGSRYEEKLTEFTINNAHRVIQFASLDDKNISQAARELKQLSISNPERIYKMEREGKLPYFVLNGKLILFVKDRIIEIDGHYSYSEPISDIWDDVLPNDLHNEGGVIFKKGKKQEKLLHRIIELTTKKGDLVLDFFLGSGTSSAVALKSQRRFIGIEQLDYAENDSVRRLQNVIGDELQHDTRGVSVDTNWQGGGSFVYCELAQANQQLVKEIMAATEPLALKEMWERLQEKGFLSYKVSPKMFNEHAEDFNDLSLDDQKRFLIECLDKNMLYIPFADIDDTHFALTENDKLLTRQFYARR